jgi:hypothetical protein
VRGEQQALIDKVSRAGTQAQGQGREGEGAVGQPPGQSRARERGGSKRTRQLRRDIYRQEHRQGGQGSRDKKRKERHTAAEETCTGQVGRKATAMKRQTKQET